ncbi:MAG: VacJ family lipoprotein [Geminicoccaceae bacterium]|nr:VacJ family lipoprotein [Geminicoccaceae bacterium]MCX8102685.1 VacJ family lipoprotein [Geminicoccaceae bacterium]MDW8371915.1 VacJ family lipoprotein [Geminicoccaceae bacterium]
MTPRPLAALLLLASAGCAALPADQLGSVEPRHRLPVEDGRERAVVEVWDPWEGFNRGVYAFNAELDERILLPVADAYRTNVPDVVRDRVRNFFDNLGEIRNAANGLLQARPEVASRAVIRFAVNSTIGIFGLFDVAGAAGLQEQDEDFGQTLGWWGVPPGPFLVLPVLGPSNLRDAVGLAVDTAASRTVSPAAEVNELAYPNPAVYGLEVVDTRANIEFRYYDSGSAFEYDVVRFLAGKQRELAIRR